MQNFVLEAERGGGGCHLTQQQATPSTGGLLAVHNYDWYVYVYYGMSLWSFFRFLLWRS